MIRMRITKLPSIFLLILLGCNSNEQKFAELNGIINDLKIENRNLKAELEGYRNQATTNYGPMPSNNDLGGYSEYAMMDDESLIETFKDYMSDEIFHYQNLSYNNKGVRVKSTIASNVSVRMLEKRNPMLFEELLKRFRKITFISWDETITLSKR